MSLGRRERSLRDSSIVGCRWNHRIFRDLLRPDGPNGNHPGHTNPNEHDQRNSAADRQPHSGRRAQGRRALARKLIDRPFESGHAWRRSWCRSWS